MSKNILKFKQTLEKKDRLFFHDIINLTHGLLLYLSSKKTLDEGSVVELKKEIQSLQSLIKDHYQLSHKDLKSDDQWISLTVAMKTVEGMIALYLPNVFVTMTVEEEDVDIYFPDFVRIMNNIIKNMGEAQAFDVSIHLEIVDEQLSIVTKNRFAKTDKSDRKRGTGLESIKEYAQSFSTRLVAGVWTNLITLPIKRHSTLKKAA